MQRMTFLILCLLSGLSAAADSVTGAKTPEPPQSAVISAEIPNFKADNPVAMSHWILQRLTFDEGGYSAGDTGTVLVGFKIDKDGRLKNLELKFGSNSDLSNKVLGLLRSVSMWNPKLENGRAVDYTQTIQFDMMLVTGDDGKLRAQDHTIYMQVERLPSFMGGGTGNFRDWLRSGMKALIDEDYPSCRVALEYVVEADGSISNALLEEALPAPVMAALEGALSQGPRFTPAQIGGEDVRAKGRVYFFMESDTAKSDDVKAGVWDPGSKTFIQPETMPQFEGGNLDTFRKWITETMVYPREALEKGISGRVVASFVIEKDGSLTNVQILTTRHELLSRAVIRVLARSPKWTPGKLRGELVRVSYTLPVEFGVVNGGFRSPSPFQRQNTMRNQLDF